MRKQPGCHHFSVCSLDFENRQVCGIITSLCLFHLTFKTTDEFFSFNGTFGLVSSNGYEVGTILTFKVWPFTCQVYTVATALFRVNDHCGALFSLPDKDYEHLMG
jgi:hypothetical protein